MFFLKKKTTAEEFATGLYYTTIQNSIDDDLKDNEGNIILTKKEQTLMLAQHLHRLLEKNKLEKPKLYILVNYTASNHKAKKGKDFMVWMGISLAEFKTVEKFFKEISPESQKFFKQKFLFDKELNPMQKTLAMSWYMSHCKIIDSIFRSVLKKFKIIDAKQGSTTLRGYEAG